MEQKAAALSSQSCCCWAGRSFFTTHLYGSLEGLGACDPLYIPPGSFKLLLKEEKPTFCFAYSLGAKQHFYDLQHWCCSHSIGRVWQLDQVLSVFKLTLFRCHLNGREQKQNPIKERRTPVLLFLWLLLEL